MNNKDVRSFFAKIASGLQPLTIFEKNLTSLIISAKSSTRRSDFFIVNFDQISHLFLVFQLLTLNR